MATTAKRIDPRDLKHCHACGVPVLITTDPASDWTCDDNGLTFHSVECRDAYMVANTHRTVHFGFRKADLLYAVKRFGAQATLVDFTGDDDQQAIDAIEADPRQTFSTCRTPDDSGLCPGHMEYQPGDAAPPRRSTLTHDGIKAFRRTPIADILACVTIERDEYGNPKLDCETCGDAACWLLDSMPCCDSCMTGLLRHRLTVNVDILPA